MENLAEKITIFLAAHNYIAEDKKDWCHYVVIKFLMSALSLCLLIPIGSLVIGWIGSILYTFTFRFLRARTGGYHAKTPHRIHCDFRLLRKYCFFPYPFVCQMQVCLYLLQLYPDFLLP